MGEQIERVSSRVRLDDMDKLHAELAKIQIRLPSFDRLTYATLRRVYIEAREADNKVVRIMSFLHPRLGRVKVDLARVERAIEGAESGTLDSGDGLLGATNPQKRKARMKVVHSDLFDQRAEIKEDLRALEEVYAHAKLKRDSLQVGWEQASRAQSSYEQEQQLHTHKTEE